MKVKVYNQEGKEVGETQLPAEVFGLKINKDLVHQAMVAQMANSRQVIAHAKTRAEVRGGGKKPWRQKGTGRARHGSIRSPIWRGGGVTFGPTKERNFSKKINKKMKRKAFLMVLSGKVRDNELIVMDDLKLEKGKTKEMTGIIKNLKTKVRNDFNKGALFVFDKKDENIFKAIKNIPKMETIGMNSLNMIDILKKKYLVMMKKGINEIKSKAQSPNIKINPNIK